MAGRLEGKVAVVTGGASGLGEATVKLFVDEGARVVVADLQAERAEVVAKELGDVARAVRCDVSAEDDVAAAVDLAVAEFGRLDVMIANAGIVGAVGPIAETPTSDWDFSIGVLLRGVFLSMKHAARVMVPQGGGGAIVSTSSVAGLVGGLGPHAYAAAKAGVLGLTRSVAAELAEHRIRVNAVVPGSIATPMTAHVALGDPDAVSKMEGVIGSRSRLGRSGLPIDIAEAFTYLASDAAGYVTGHALVVDAGDTSAFGANQFVKRPDREVLREAGKRGL